MLLPLPDDLQAEIDTKLPPRWSRNNPVDLAGGETRDTIPEVLPDGRRSSRRGRGGVPRPRDPVEPGPADAPGPLLPRLRHRADRRLPRAPGRPVRRGGRRGLGGHRQADPDRHRAGRGRSGEPRAGRRSAPPAGSATPAPTGPSPPSATSTATPAGATVEGCRAAWPGGSGGRGRPASSSRCSWSASWWRRPSGCGGSRRRPPTRRPRVSRRPAARPRPGPAVGSPILSARRMPGDRHRPADDDVAPGRASRASARPRPAPGCLLVTLDGTPLYELRSDEPVIPASNQKLVTGRRRPRGARPRPAASRPPSSRRPCPEAWCTGDLTLVGGGDPLLATQPYLDWLAKAGKEVPQPHTSFEALADADRGRGCHQHQRLRGRRREPLRRGPAGAHLARRLPAVAGRRSAQRPAGERRLHVVRARPPRRPIPPSTRPRC